MYYELKRNDHGVVLFIEPAPKDSIRCGSYLIREPMPDEEQGKRIYGNPLFPKHERKQREKWWEENKERIMEEAEKLW